MNQGKLSVKKGDTVIWDRFGDCGVYRGTAHLSAQKIAMVRKDGIIVLENGGWFTVQGFARGKASGRIMEATPELLAEAERQAAERLEERRRLEKQNDEVRAQIANAAAERHEEARRIFGEQVEAATEPMPGIHQTVITWPDGTKRFLVATVHQVRHFNYGECREYTAVSVGVTLFQETEYRWARVDMEREADTWQEAVYEALGGELPNK